MPSQITVRPGTREDADRIAVLSGQLGYPATAQQMQQRLSVLQDREDDAIYVATTEEGFVIGWVHVHRCYMAISPTLALILALVVDEAYRRCGVGQMLVERIEQWARDRDCQTILVRSNILRQEAHCFYQRLGFINIKQSMVFAKSC